jgi:hypothetical protein
MPESNTTAGHVLGAATGLVGVTGSSDGNSFLFLFTLVGLAVGLLVAGSFITTRIARKFIR